MGYIKDLTEIFDRVRLTVAPLNFGAGIKGKVIESLAAGIPCVCTPLAAEGLDFPTALRGLRRRQRQGLGGFDLRPARETDGERSLRPRRP